MKKLLLLLFTLSLSAKEADYYDFSNAIKIGNGSNIIIEFSDVSCPYCAKGNDQINRITSTRYVFLTALPSLDNEAKKKAIHVLCSKNKTEELDKAFNGGLKNKKLLTCEAGVKKFTYSQKMFRERFGRREGAGLPMYLIHEKEIEGFDKYALEKEGAI